MNFFKKYIEYLRDNPKGYWFKRKMYGWGWIPVKWQGWAVIVIFILFVFFGAFNLEKMPTNSEITWFIVKIIFSIILLFLICYKKGEKPKWQWGIKNI